MALLKFLLISLVVFGLSAAEPAHAFGRRKPKPKPTPSPTVVPCCAFEVEVFEGDPSRGVHLAGAQVQVGDQSKLSGDDGKAAFSNVSRGHHLIQVDLAGYQHYEFDHDIQNDAVGANAFTMSLERIPVAAPPTVSLTGKPASTISTRSATFTFSASGGEAPLRFRCSMDEFGGGPIDENCTSPKSYNNLAEGNRGFRLRVIDRLGRSSETVLYRFDVDTSGPVVTITSAPPASTQATTASFSFSSPDASGGFECKLDSAAFSACSSPKAYSNVAVGSHTFQVRAKDGIGNTGASASASWTVTAVPQPNGPIVPIGGTLALGMGPGVAPIRFPDLAYDAAHDVYLVVSGNNMTGGYFISGSGTPIGSPFQINQANSWTQGQRVFYAPAADRFLVTWQVESGGVRVWGRILRYNNGQVEFLSPEFQISGTQSHAEHPGGIAYSAAHQEFITAWQALGSSSIHARRISISGAILGDEIVVKNGAGQWHTDPDMIYNASRDEYFFVYAAEHSGGGTVRAQRVQAGTGALLGAEILVATTPGTWIPEIDLIPSTGQYFVSWYQLGLAGRVLNPDGSAAGGVFPIAPGNGSYDCYNVAYNPASATFTAVFCGNSAEVMAAEINPLTGVSSEVSVVTASGAVNGNYYPRLASHGSRVEWLVVASREYGAMTVQRVGRR